MWGSSSKSSKDGSGSVQNYDMTSSQLNDLYNNRRVTSIQSFERPLSSDTKNSSVFHHKGVVATMDNGDRYLVHKGSGFGKKEGGNFETAHRETLISEQLWLSPMLIAELILCIDHVVPWYFPGNTVVVDAKHMSSRWQPTSQPQATPANYGLSNLVKAGGKDYNVIKDNCIHAANRMMSDAKK